MIALVVVLAGILIFVATRSKADNSRVQSLEEARAALPLEMADGLEIGLDSAPITLTEFEDFQCPFCLRYTSDQEPTIVEEYVRTGKVKIVFQHFPLLRTESFRAATAAQCAADQDKFWTFHNRLFTVQAKANQANAEKTNIGRFSDDKLREYAQEEGLDMAAYDACFASPDTLALVQENDTTARSLGLQGTPAFLLNGSPIGSGAPNSLAGWRELLDSAILRVTSSPTPTASASPSPTTSPGTSPSPSPAATATPTP